MGKYYLNVFCLFCFFVFIFVCKNVEASLPLSGKLIIVDAGHGAQDPGTMYKNIYEKDINLSISKFLEEELVRYGASVIMTRDGDYDLSKPNTNHRKKSDFDNRVKLINSSGANMYLSIHLNYLADSTYRGPQVFYNYDNKFLAETIQAFLNKKLDSDRKIKQIPTSTYMYNKVKIKGVLIECGFLSNAYERELLIKEDYQKVLANTITKAIVNYYS